MSEMWNKWIGQVVDHKYQLQQYLGTTDHSVVFLAEFHDPEVRQAAIKFVSAGFSESEQQIATWKEAAQLSHPHLIRIYGAGACKIEDMDLLYVAMEYAEENLGQVLPHRALVAEETKEMLEFDSRRAHVPARPGLGTRTREAFECAGERGAAETFERCVIYRR